MPASLRDSRHHKIKKTKKPKNQKPPNPQGTTSPLHHFTPGSRKPKTKTQNPNSGNIFYRPFHQVLLDLHPVQ